MAGRLQLHDAGVITSIEPGRTVTTPGPRGTTVVAHTCYECDRTIVATGSRDWASDAVMHTLHDHLIDHETGAASALD